VGYATATAVLMALSPLSASSATAQTPSDGPDTHRGTYTDWGPWQPIPTARHEKFRACGTTVHIKTVVNRERVRVRTDAAGVVYQQFRGALWERLVDNRGRRSAALNVSGWSAPGGAVAYPDGDFMYDAVGANLIYPHRNLDVVRGMPRAFVSQGPITLLSHPHARVRMLREPQKWVSVCALLRGARQPVGAHARGGYTDWSRWRANHLGDLTHHICGTAVKEHVVTDGEQARTRQDSHDNLYMQIRGDFRVRLTARDGGTTGVQDASGETPPGGWVFYAHGQAKSDLLVDSLGRNEEIQDLPSFGSTHRLPRASLTQGPVTALSVNHHVRLLREPQEVMNVCTMLRH
jgi:hypothetical protein